MEKDLKVIILEFLDNFNASEINEYFANDFVDDREKYFNEKESQEVLEFLNDTFIDIDVDFRDKKDFEEKVLETLQQAIKMIDAK